MCIKDSSFVSPNTNRLQVLPNGRSIIRVARVPKPEVLVDTRERVSFPLYANLPKWIGGERRVNMKTGVYTLEGKAR
jgi:hypothetical protein